MKKVIWITLAISLIAYASGLSSLARTKMLPSYGLRISSFTFDKQSWRHQNQVYATGVLNISDSSYRTLESRKCALKIDLDSNPNATKPTLVENAMPKDGTALKNIVVTYGSDAKGTAKGNEGEIYSVSASISGTHFIVDARSGSEPRVFAISLAEGYKRTQEAQGRMWLMTPVAHLIDFITAPLQLIYVLLVLSLISACN